MMPPPDEFEVHMTQLGLKHDDIIIVYDGKGIFSAPRAWFMLKTFGAKHVSILDGGLPLWIEQGRPMEEGSMTGCYQSEHRAFTARYNKDSVALSFPPFFQRKFATCVFPFALET